MRQLSSDLLVFIRLLNTKNANDQKQAGDKP